MIPADQLSPAAAAALRTYLMDEIHRELSNRRPLEDRWNAYEKAYRGIPEVEVKEFPFLGAANLVIPVVATDVDTIFSRIMGILFAPENLWSTRALRPEMADFAPRIQEFMQWAQGAELNAYNVIADWVLEMCKLGTGILKQRYRRNSRWVYQYRETPEGIIQQIRQAIVADHPVLEHVPLADFLVPAAAKDIQSAAWCAERVRMRWEQYQERVQAGIYAPNPYITPTHAHETPTLFHRNLQSLDRFQPSVHNELEFWEVWTDFDVSGRGMRMPVVATIHLPTLTFARIDYNPFSNQERPYSHARFLRQSGRFYGIGLAEMLLPTQDEVSAMHNQRIDAGTISNSTMFKGRKGTELKENEPIWPGRIFLLDDPEKDLIPMNMGQAFDPSVTYEQLTVDYVRRRTGVNDYMVGAANPSTGYSTATTTIHLLQEAARKIDQTLREIRGAVAESGIRILELYQQFNQGGKPFAVLGQRDGAMVQQVLNFPTELLRYSVGVETTATSAALNKEVEVRTNTMVFELTSGFYQQMIQTAALFVNPQVPPMMKMLAMQMMQGGSILMRRLLESYGVPDVDRLIPDLMQAMQMQMMGQGGQIGGPQGLIGPGAGIAAGPGASSGMGGIPAGASSIAPAGFLSAGDGRFAA
jgi:hypothetical protein